MHSKEFWVDAAERAVKTFAQALVALLAVGTPIFEVQWGEALGIAATSAVISVLTSVASVKVGGQVDAAALPAAARPRPATTE